MATYSISISVNKHEEEKKRKKKQVASDGLLPYNNGEYIQVGKTVEAESSKEAAQKVIELLGDN